MTENEAKTKWCPHVRYGLRDQDTSNRWTFYDKNDEARHIPDECKCIASDCMMWIKDTGEWQIDGKQTPKSELNKYPTPEAAEAIWVKFGRCGLSK